MRAAIYIRVSTRDQATDGFSIATQRSRLTSFAQSQDWDIHDYYIDDGKSAKNTKRDQLQRMLEDIKTDQVDVVLVYKLDRLTRSVVDLHELLEVFEDNKTAFRSATEVYDTTTAMGRLFITLVGALAQFERENLSERVSINMEQMVIDGNWHGGRVAIGLDWIDKALVTIEEQARLVRLMYKMYCFGDDDNPRMGDNKLTQWLNIRGYRTKTGEPWTPSAVRYVLTNPIYIQMLRWHYTSDGEYFEIKSTAIPRIVDDETWEYAQRLRKEKASLHPRQAGGDYYFSGRLKCGRCGYSMYSKKSTSRGREYRYYVCSKKSSGTCDLPMIDEKLVEEYFLNYIRDIQEDTAAFEVAAGQDQDDSQEIKVMRNELKKIKDRRTKWQRAYGDDVITLDDLRERTMEDRVREQELKDQLDKGTEERVMKNPEEIAAMLQDFEIHWIEATREQRKNTVQILIKSMEVNSPFNKMPGQWKKRKINLSNIEFN